LFRHAVTSNLTISYHPPVIEPVERLLLCPRSFESRRNGAAEKEMKIYLLMLLIGTLLTAVHFTSTPEQGPKTLP
jgi:hypothetical protein